MLEFVKSCAQSDMGLQDSVVNEPSHKCYLCRGYSSDGFWYVAPPKGETTFPNSALCYPRSFMHCRQCNHWTSSLLGRETLNYESEYSTSTYGGSVRDRFIRIVNLSDSESDNQHRVHWIEARVQRLTESGASKTVLDIGSGLGVFPYLMTQHGWKVLAVEPSRHLCSHLRDLQCFEVREGSLESVNSGEVFDLITFNKVIEHVADPIQMLIDARRLLAPFGELYVEVPDGVGAAESGQDREEFFIEHLHVFSTKSLENTLVMSGYVVANCDTVIEPSGKFTIRLIARRES